MSLEELPAGALKAIESIKSECTRLKPLVVVSCIAYNHEPYIREALDGFVSQKTDFPFVVVIHDDASTDNTANIIREYANNYPEIILPIFEVENQYSKRNGILGKIMQQARETTGAKYVAFCEGDDYWTDPLKLQKQVDFLENNHDFVGCYGEVDCKNHLKIESGEMSHEIVKNWGKGSPSFEEHLMHQYYLAPPTWVYRVSYQRRMSKKPIVDGTYAISLDFLGGYKFKFIDEVFGVYRIASSGVSHVTKLPAFFKRKKGLWITQREYAKIYPHLVSTENKKRIRTHIFDLMGLAFLSKDKDLFSLGYRYARFTKRYHLIAKYKSLKLPIVQWYLKKKYQKSGVEF